MYQFIFLINYLYVLGVTGWGQVAVGAGAAPWVLHGIRPAAHSPLIAYPRLLWRYVCCGPTSDISVISLTGATELVLSNSSTIHSISVAVVALASETCYSTVGICITNLCQWPGVILCVWCQHRNVWHRQPWWCKDDKLESHLLVLRTPVVGCSPILWHWCWLRARATSLPVVVWYPQTKMYATTARRRWNLQTAWAVFTAKRSRFHCCGCCQTCQPVYWYERVCCRAAASNYNHHKCTEVAAVAVHINSY